MKKSYHNLIEELGTVRAGRANPHVLDKIKVDYYGTPTSLQQVANVSVPEPRMIPVSYTHLDVYKRQAVLPAITLSITGVANIAMHTREKMIDVMESDYMLFATARGESKKTMVIRHGLRNIALPAMTLQFASISEIIGGSVLVEQAVSYTHLDVYKRQVEG